MKNLIKISVVARILGCDQQTIRRYDRLGLYAPRRDRAGNRVFGPEDIETLRDIRASRRPGRPPKARGEVQTPMKLRRKPERGRGEVTAP